MEMDIYRVLDMLHHMATMLVCYGSHFESKMANKIQKPPIWAKKKFQVDYDVANWYPFFGSHAMILQIISYLVMAPKRSLWDILLLLFFFVLLLLQLFNEKNPSVNLCVWCIYIYILYKSSLKFDHYYFITDGSLCLLYYSKHSNATITMSMVWLNFDLLLFHKNKKCCHLLINVINP